MRRSEFSRLPSHRGCQRHERQVRKACSSPCIPKRAGAVVARASHGRRDFRNEKRRYDHGVAAFLDLREKLQALGMPFFVRIERVHEDTRVDGVPDTVRAA